MLLLRAVGCGCARTTLAPITPPTKPWRDALPQCRGIYLKECLPFVSVYATAAIWINHTQQPLDVLCAHSELELFDVGTELVVVDQVITATPL
jgi:hypothetical protein